MRKIITIVSSLIIIVGVVMIGAGIFGACFTYKNIVQEKITTPNDSALPGVLVEGPRTLKVQIDIIRKHTLDMSDGQTYAQMPRQIEKRDESGNIVMGTDGKPVMVPNEARNTWITATTLITALGLGIVAYALSGVTILIGVIFTLIGVVVCVLVKK